MSPGKRLEAASQSRIMNLEQVFAAELQEIKASYETVTMQRQKESLNKDLDKTLDPKELQKVTEALMPKE